MRAKAGRTKDGIQFFVPSDSPIFQQCATDAEIFHLRDGFFLVSFGSAAMQKTEEAKPTGTAAQTAAPSDEEIAVLRKLSAIRFENRIPSEVDKSFSPAEKKVLQSLIKKKLVTEFTSAKYKSGVYNIASSVYPHIQGSASAQNSPRPQSASGPAGAYFAPIETLEHNGYMIVESEGEAKLVASRIEAGIKSGDIIGVRGFDRKFYVAKKQFYIEHEARLLDALGKKPMAFEEAARACNIEPAAAHVLLVLLADKGEIIEKSKGAYATA